MQTLRKVCVVKISQLPHAKGEVVGRGFEGGRKKLIKCDIYQIGTQHGGQTCKLQGGTVVGGRGMVPKRAACCMRGKLAMKFRFILLKRALKERQSFLYKMFAAACNSLCCKFNLFFIFFSGAFFGTELRLDNSQKDSAGKGCASFAGLCMRRSRLGDLLVVACGAANTLRILNKLLHGSRRVYIPSAFPRRDCLAILKSTANGSPEIEENKSIKQRKIDEVLSVKSCREKLLLQHC